jgi:hypothetical protein
MTHNPNIKTVYTMSNEPTGFPNRTDSVLSFDNGTRTLSIAPASTYFEYYVQGIKYRHTSAVSTTITDTEGLWHFYFDGYNLQSTQTFSTAIITQYAYVANAYWDAANNIAVLFGEERHGLTMDGNTHLYLHNSVGAAYSSGFALSDFSVDGTGNNATDGYFSVDNGTFFDEDIRHSVVDGSPQDLYPIANLPVFYKTGADGYWRKKTSDVFPVIYSGTVGYTGANGRLPFNEYTGSVWQLTQVGNNSFVLVHIFATNDLNNPIIAIQGIAEYSRIADARTGATTEISQLTNLPFAEMVALGSVIFETDAAYTNPIKGRIRSTDTGDNYVDFRKIGSLPVNQLSDHGNLSGLNDPDHPASAIFTNTTNFSGVLSSADTTVQSALDTLDDLSLNQISPLAVKGDLLTRTISGHARLAAGPDGYVLTADSTDGYGIKWALSGGGANTALSNLSSTAINQNLLPSTDDTYSIGSASLRWKDGYFANNSLHIVSTVGETGVATDWNLSLDSDGYFQIRDVNTTHLTLSRFGNMGVGIAQPTEKLDVDGYVKVAQGHKFSDNTYIISAPAYAYKSANESVTSSTTLQDDDALVVTIPQSGIYKIDACLFLDVLGTGGAKVALNGTVSFNNLLATIDIVGDGSTYTSGRVNLFGTAVSHGSVGAGSHCVTLEGTIEATSSGTLLIQWAQDTSDGAATVMQRGSTLQIKRIL